MLEIQSQPQVKVRQSVGFQGSPGARPSFKSSHDSFDRDAIDAERDEKLDQIDEQKRQFDELADELENSDSNIVKKTGKGVRFIASVFGIIGTFVAAKYSSKVAIETLKTVAKNPAIQKTIESAKEAREPLGKLAVIAKDFVTKVAEKPKVKEAIAKVTNSKAANVVREVLKNEKVAKVLEPVKNTLESVKNIKINGKSIQNFVENTMAATTTGSVIVDNVTGRNNDKSNLEVASGV